MLVKLEVKVNRAPTGLDASSDLLVVRKNFSGGNSLVDTELLPSGQQGSYLELTNLGSDARLLFIKVSGQVDVELDLTTGETFNLTVDSLFIIDTAFTRVSITNLTQKTIDVFATC